MIRLGNVNDLSQIMEIVQDAKEKFRLDGTLQWTNEGYPQLDDFIYDLKYNKLFVLEEIILNKKIILGVCTVSYKKENCYDRIIGNWLNEKDYAVIHRICVRKEFYHQGYAKEMLLFVQEEIKKNKIFNIRIDTHEDNISMRKLLENNGYVRCGIIYIERTDIENKKRIAYQKII